jgi:hypothetical protein
MPAARRASHSVSATCIRPWRLDERQPGAAAAATTPATQCPCMTVARVRATVLAIRHPAASASGAARYAAPLRLTSARSADAYPNTLSRSLGAYL